jgi:branched-chain amino acid transport system ATP-binding protein
VLTLDTVEVAIAGVPILRGVSLAVPTGAMCGLIGRNGAGKTTLMRAVMGLLPARAGRIAVEGTELAGAPAHRRAALGIGYMPEDRRLVPDFTVEENLLLPVWAARLEGAAERLRWVYRLMPEVEAFAPRRAASLSGGQQKLVALARALMAGRHMLLLDEPFEGVAPVLARRLAQVLVDLKGEGISVLLADSDERHAADLVDATFHIERGAITERPPRA